MLKNGIRNSSLFVELLPIAEGLNLTLVDVQKNVLNQAETHVSIEVMNKETDTSIDDCYKFHRAVQPRLELMIGRDILSMDVSTPGLQRNLKDVYEFSIFTGKQARVYSTTVSSWIEGEIASSDDSSVSLVNYKIVDTSETGDEIKINFTSISKAKLDYKFENKKLGDK